MSMLMGGSGSTTIATSGTTSSGSGDQKQQSNTRRLSYQDEEYISKLMKQFGGSAQADTVSARKQAIKDSNGAITDLFAQFKDTALPEILSQSQKSGGYGATATAQLSNDAFSRTVAKGAQLRLQAIGDYENRAMAKSQTALSGLSTSLQALLQANEQSTSASEYSTRAKSRTNSLSNTGTFEMSF